MSVRWFVVNVLPHKETLARDNLQRQGFEVFFPWQRQIVRHARRFEERMAPFFPGYLFAHFDPDSIRWRSINGTFGVRHLLMSAERPLAVPRGVVESFQSRADGSGCLMPSDDLHIGERVRIGEGPFADFCGTVHQLAGPDRVRVLLEVMQRTVIATVEAGSLYRAA